MFSQGLSSSTMTFKSRSLLSVLVPSATEPKIKAAWYRGLLLKALTASIPFQNLFGSSNAGFIRQPLSRLAAPTKLGHFRPPHCSKPASILEVKERSLSPNDNG